MKRQLRWQNQTQHSFLWIEPDGHQPLGRIRNRGGLLLRNAVAFSNPGLGSDPEPRAVYFSMRASVGRFGSADQLTKSSNSSRILECPLTSNAWSPPSTTT